MHFISYKWAKNQLWNDEFEYIFRVRLKDLTTDREKNYKNELENFSETDLLSCFMHNSLHFGKKRDDDLKIF
jgi:hypothetical protein